MLLLLLPPVCRRAASARLPIPISRKLLPNISFQNRPSMKMASPGDWERKKKEILNTARTDRRKLYKSEEYVTVDSIMPWKMYFTSSKDVMAKTPSKEDIELFQKLKIESQLNERLSEKVAIYKGDITRLEVDAIVNAANSRLKAGGGVDGAIHRAAGPYLQLECNSFLGCATGDAKISGGYDLPANYVIHTVGPQDQSVEKLESCYEKCFSFHKEYNIKTIAFPCISTGIYGFPNRLAGHVALQKTRKFLEDNPEMKRVIFCTYMPTDVDIYEKLMQLYFPCNPTMAMPRKPSTFAS